jgi:hypothetical protein
MMSRLPLWRVAFVASLCAACASGTNSSTVPFGDAGNVGDAAPDAADGAAEDANLDAGIVPGQHDAEAGPGADAAVAEASGDTGVIAPEASVTSPEAGEAGAVYREGGASVGAWTVITPPAATSGCNGVVANRLTGAVLTNAFNGGVLESTDQGATWARVDHNTVSGGVVTGPAFDVDQNDPVRVAEWSLDGTSAWTNNGSAWTETMQIGRNWDFGATDWSSTNPTTMFVSQHESGGAVWVSTNAGQEWTKLAITVLASGDGFPPPKYAMVGVMGPSTLIYSNGNGIYRSTDTGASFTQVSSFNPTTRIPVLFKNVFYLGGDNGLMVSRDQGATWTPQGTPLGMWVGPYFGSDENTIVVADDASIYRTVNAGVTWTKIASVPTGTMYYNPQIWGGIAWDPVGNILYSAGEQSPLLKLKL